MFNYMGWWGVYHYFNAEEEIQIKKYNDIQDFIEEFITNKTELDFLRNLTVEQEKEIERLEEKLKWMKWIF